MANGRLVFQTKAKETPNPTDRIDQMKRWSIVSFHAQSKEMREITKKKPKTTQKNCALFEDRCRQLGVYVFLFVCLWCDVLWNRNEYTCAVMFEESHSLTATYSILLQCTQDVDRRRLQFSTLLLTVNGFRGPDFLFNSLIVRLFLMR